MAMSINTNVVTLNAQRNTGLNSSALAVTMQRLSSGLRVNSAKDDAAGLAIAERMQAQSKGLSVAARNANDGISLAQTAEGALGKMGDMLQRMRELAVQSANATNSDDDRKALQAEVSQLTAEIDRVAKTTTFNGQKILDGSFSGGVFQVGASSGDNITVAGIANAKASNLGQVNYASTTLTVNTAQVVDLTAISAGTLKLRSGEVDYELGAISAASSVQERMGQVVAAINSQTASTGMTAYLKPAAGGASFDVELRGTKTELVTDNGVTSFQVVAVGLKGFSQAQTGLQVWSYAAPVLGPGYATYVNALAAVNSQYNLGVTIGAVDSYSEAGAAALRTQVKNAYDAYYGSNLSVSGLLGAGGSAFFSRSGSQVANATGVIMGGFSSDPMQTVFSQLGISWNSDWQTAITVGGNIVHMPNFIEVIPGYVAEHGATSALNELVNRINSGAVNTAAATGELKKLLDWQSMVSSASMLTFNNPPTGLDPFTPASYTPTSMLAAVNAALGGGSASFADIGASYVNGSQWAGNNVGEQYNNALVAWNAAENYLLAEGGLGISATHLMQHTGGLATLSVATAEGAWLALQSLDGALDQVNAARGSLGALQVRFEKAVENIGIQNENISAARGRIVDTDFAFETANFSRNKILQRAGMAMVAQANQMQQNVLSLLR